MEWDTFTYLVAGWAGTVGTWMVWVTFRFLFVIRELDDACKKINLLVAWHEPNAEGKQEWKLHPDDHHKIIIREIEAVQAKQNIICEQIKAMR